MSAPTIKPGIRCECRDVSHHACFCGDSCAEDAVRLVTVRVPYTGHKFAFDAPWKEIRHDVPMCAPCAAHAEKETER